MRQQEQTSSDETNIVGVPHRRRRRPALRAGLLAGAATLAVALALPAGALAQPRFDDPTNYAVGDQPLSVATSKLPPPLPSSTETLSPSVLVTAMSGRASHERARWGPSPRR